MTSAAGPFHGPLVVSYGAGVDSTAMLVEMRRRDIIPDLILFADVGNEFPYTYRYLDVMRAWLARNGFPPIVTVRNPSPIAGDQSLGAECLRKSILPALAFGQHSCSIKWKIVPQNQHLRRWQPALDAWANGQTVTKLIGYDAGHRDKQRAASTHGKAGDGYTLRFPLIEWSIERARCAEIIATAGLPPARKSSCFFCPALKAHEVDDLQRDHPELAAVALEMERRAIARGLRTVKGLGRNWSWTDRLNQLRLPDLSPTSST